MEKDNQKSYLGAAYTLSMIVACTTRYGDIQLGYQHQVIIGLFWIMVGLARFGLNGFRAHRLLSRDTLWAVKRYMLPHVVIHLYTIALMATGKVSKSYFTTNLTVYVPTLLAVLSVYLFGAKALRYNCIAVFASWLLSVAASTAIKGPLIFPHAIIQAFVDPNDSLGGLTANYLELHDLVLAIGYVLTFYLFAQAKPTRRNVLTTIGVLLIMTLGMKRVAVLGVLLAVAFFLLAKLLKEKVRYRACRLAGWFAFAVCFGFIFILSSGSAFYDFLTATGINPMGRNYYYKKIMEYAWFSPSFPGIGRNVVTQLLNSKLSYLRVGGVHSDIIKMYVENGFIMFGLWLWYHLLYMPSAYKKRFGYKVSFVYFGIVIYTFTLYLTDNIEIYFICQMLQITIPLTYAVRQREEETNAQINAE